MTNTVSLSKRALGPAPPRTRIGTRCGSKNKSPEKFVPSCKVREKFTKNSFPANLANEGIKKLFYFVDGCATTNPLNKSLSSHLKIS